VTWHIHRKKKNKKEKKKKKRVTQGRRVQRSRLAINADNRDKIRHWTSHMAACTS
jgi:hypothetical protein